MPVWPFGSRFLSFLNAPRLPSPLFDRLGKNRNGTRLSWRLPQKKRGSRQNRRPSIRLGKFPRKPFIMATTLFWDGDRAKAGDNPQPTWGKSNGKPFMMASPQEKAGITPKRATCVGKTEAEAVYHGDLQEQRR